MPQQLNRPTSRRPGFITGAAVGRQFSPLSGFRLGLDFNNAATRLADAKVDRYTFTSLSLDYMFDISKFLPVRSLPIALNQERPIWEEKAVYVLIGG